MAVPEPTNVLGALLFIAYVGAALGLSSVLVNDALALASKSKRVTGRAQIYAGFAAISFATMSYRMLRFLLLHYQGWAATRGLKVDATTLAAFFAASPKSGQIMVWEWLSTSSLFVTFAQELVPTLSARWWSQSAVMHTMLVETYMAIEGTRREIPHLWAYHVLAQIIPVSFVQNMFLLAVRLKPIRKQKSGALELMPKQPFFATRTLVQLLLNGIFVANVVGFQDAQLYNYVLPVIVSSRVLLLVPYLFLRPKPAKGALTDSQPIGAKPEPKTDATAWHAWHHQYEASYVPTILPYAGLMFLHARVLYQVGKAGNAGSMLEQLHEAATGSAAVAALGYDWLLALVTLGASTLLEGAAIES